MRTVDRTPPGMFPAGGLNSRAFGKTTTDSEVVDLLRICAPSLGNYAIQFYLPETGGATFIGARLSTSSAEFPPRRTTRTNEIRTRVAITLRDYLVVGSR